MSEPSLGDVVEELVALEERVRILERELSDTNLHVSRFETVGGECL